MPSTSKAAHESPEDEKLPVLPPRWRAPSGEVVLTLDEQHCSRLRDLPEWSGRDPDFVAESFLASRASRWQRTLSDLPPGAEVRVLVDQWSRQAFAAHGLVVVHIDSF